MTSEPVVGVVLGRQVVGKMTLIYICLPFPSPTPQSQLTGTSSYYWFRCHYPLITYLKPAQIQPKSQFLFHKYWSKRDFAYIRAYCRIYVYAVAAANSSTWVALPCKPT